ncbi:TauD/TfdA dioxygenase family protein [Antrihabitans cavernicola]|uniref:TauD/TfdA family dioxygenase n=1 Tax=Antrihabitans cavernicola TaxID=2495913 RepID=A0A5A7SCF3_9NOCA|nr:TauD/TfdA family dioxygenase [Spelaeibacter cavernicola]KAA0022273.1 TauD/TfdA family dioxygenase [Spelaeibacter cavernicola]
MRRVALHPVGIEISDVSLVDADTNLIDELRHLLAEHGAAILPDQPIDDTAFVAFLRAFGDLTFSTGETPVPNFPDLNLISNIGRTTPPRSVFHADTTYVRHPPAYTALRAVEIPAQGGETLFTNQYRAYDTLPDDVRIRLTGKTIRHVVTGVDLGADDESEADHPVFLQHPISGRTALYLSTPQRCMAISGEAEQQGRDMIDYLYAHSTAAENIYRHSWSPGDVVMWDNRCVLHRADHSDVVGNRLMHRGMVADTSRSA